MHESEVAQSCLTLRDPMDCSLPGSSLHGIFQVRVLEWVAIAFSTTDAHLGYFHVFTTVTNVAMNTGVQINLHNSDFFSFDYIPRDGTDGSYGSCIFNFLRSLQSGFTVAAQTYSPTNNAQGFTLLHILVNTCCFLTLFLPLIVSTTNWHFP